MPTPQQLPFPARGLNQTAGYHAQPQGTTPSALNVRPHDAISGRLRGGRRAGLSKWFANPVGDGGPIHAMTSVVRATEFNTANRDRILLSHSNLASPGTTGLNHNGALVFSDNSGALPAFFGATRDERGDYYTAYLADDLTTHIKKYSPAGQIIWDVEISVHSSVVRGLFYNSSYKQLIVVVVDPVIGWTAAPTTLAISAGFSSQTGDHLWFSTEITGGFRVGFATGSDGTTILAGTYDAAQPSIDTIVRLDATGVKLSGITLGSGGADLVYQTVSVNASGDIATRCTEAHTTWPGAGGTPADTFILSADLSTITKTFDKAWTPKAFSATIAWATDGNLCVGGDRSVTPHTTEKFNFDTGATMWQFDSGGGSNYPYVDVLTDGNIIVTDEQNTNWPGAGGTTANVFSVKDIDGTINWTANTGAFIFNTNIIKGTPSSRETSLVCVESGGVRKIFDHALTTPTNGADALSTTYGTVQLQSAFNQVFMVDGTNTKVFKLDTDEVVDWVADVGTIQQNARLIALYRGRVVISGVVADPHNWFMSKVGDPFDWDYSPTDTSAIDAVAGNSSPAGLIGDIVTALIPLDDDILIIGGDSTIWQVTGDPAAGGSIDLVSDQTGIVFGQVWAKDPNNFLYFMGIDGIYEMGAGQPPMSLTDGRLDDVFRDLDIAANQIQITWDFRGKQLWVSITPLTGAATTAVYVWDKRTDSWWKDEYPTTVGPMTTYGFDAEGANDVAFLLGCRDGYIRHIDNTANDDDGEGITNYVRFTPITASDPSSQVILNELNVSLGEGSGDVEVRVYRGQTVEQSMEATTPRVRKTISGGRNGSVTQRVQGASLCVELGQTASSERWALERLAIQAHQTGRARSLRRS